MRLKGRKAVTKDYEITINAPNAVFTAYLNGADSIRLDRYERYELIGSTMLLGEVKYSINDTTLVSISEIKDNKCVLHANAKNKLGEIILSAKYNGITYTKTIKIIPLW